MSNCLFISWTWRLNKLRTNNHIISTDSDRSQHHWTRLWSATFRDAPLNQSFEAPDANNETKNTNKKHCGVSQNFFCVVRNRTVEPTINWVNICINRRNFVSWNSQIVVNLYNINVVSLYLLCIQNKQWYTSKSWLYNLGCTYVAELSLSYLAFRQASISPSS